MKAAPRLINKRLYRITHLDACDSEKRDSWLEWRRTLKLIPTSSTLCSYFGYGHQSLNCLIKEKIIGENTVSNSFSERAMKHGTDNEKKAKLLFEQYLKVDKIDQYMKAEDGNVSYHSSIQWGEDPPVEVVCTPDSLFLFNNEFGWGKMVVEYKCPYKIVVERGNNSILAVALGFLYQNPFGKHGAFIQASTYALWCQAELIYTVFYFTDFLDEEYIVVFCYRPSEELFDIIYQALGDTAKHLNDFNNTSAKDKPHKSYRTSTAMKKEMNSLMKSCFIHKCIYDKIGAFVDY